MGPQPNPHAVDAFGFAALAAEPQAVRRHRSMIPKPVTRPSSVACPWCKQQILVSPPPKAGTAEQVIAAPPHLLTDLLTQALTAHRAVEQIRCPACVRPISLAWYGGVRW